MSQFVVSARKYRPATFDTVVGQAHITNTLKNAIRNNHVAQAFLFCGPRGVGKTTCARILAKTLNCENKTEGIEACNVCESCVSFNNNQSLNIYELDAASNNSVEDIRSLVEQVRYAPHSGQYKVYIIDEVHMLSTSAFNAFLKTLEEPPSYAIFILATTEKHKIIPTILSRCQIFDFNRIQIEDIASHLEYVAKSEGITAEPDALHIIAQKADGALRDALSIFDQIVSYAGNTVTYKDVINNLNILDYEYYFRATDDLVNGNIPGTLMLFSELLNEGFDAHNFINGLGSHFRDLLVSQDAQTVQLLEVSPAIRERYLAQSKSLNAGQLLRLMDISGKCDLEYRSARNHRLHVELALIRMCNLSGKTPEAAFLAAEKKNPELNSAAKPTAASPVVKPVVATPPQAIPGSDNPKASSPEATIPPAPSPAAAKPIEIKPEVESKPLSTATRNPLPRTGGSLLKGASLNAGVKKTEEAIVPIVSSGEIARTPFTQELLHERWNDYAIKQKSEGKPQLHATLTMNKPVLLTDDRIELIIHNQAQENLMNEEKAALMDYLRTVLNNYHLQLSTRLVEEAGAQEAYTIKEKYQKMVEKNPELEDFRKQLGLELDN
jgi:DNA polymerase-3 subunit gamma/tau